MYAYAPRSLGLGLVSWLLLLDGFGRAFGQLNSTFTGDSGDWGPPGVCATVCDDGLDGSWVCLVRFRFLPVGVGRSGFSLAVIQCSRSLCPVEDQSTVSGVLGDLARKSRPNLPHALPPVSVSCPPEQERQGGTLGNTCRHRPGVRRPAGSRWEDEGLRKPARSAVIES
ncbi:hypothetical protein NLJ89_g5456 [Agrocybe chaxingu]|uniref:Uncharacterized protein n=1 Tax=Agrocybe chaxingu TaxID=84603 RepID=A0A9W8MX89_9AGAR|nr:hypothetical protein NLJ89_g5456 [Agrocybe chaxingu]